MIRRFFQSTMSEGFTPPPFAINWTATSNNSSNSACLDGGWVITQGGQKIRFNISDSANCVSGGCPITQIGEAVATIQVGSSDVNMSLDFTGLGEAQSAGSFERIEFRLDSLLLAKGSSAGGGLGCVQAIPIVKEVLVQGPYTLSANTIYEFKINFTTGDALYHVGAYYEIDLSFS